MDEGIGVDLWYEAGESVVVGEGDGVDAMFWRRCRTSCTRGAMTRASKGLCW
jgi:hypothetical protein